MVLKKKKTFWPLFFSTVFFFLKKKNMFFFKKTEHVFFFQENTNPHRDECGGRRPKPLNTEWTLPLESLQTILRWASPLQVDLLASTTSHRLPLWVSLFPHLDAVGCNCLASCYRLEQLRQHLCFPTGRSHSEPDFPYLALSRSPSAGRPVGSLSSIAAVLPATRPASIVEPYKSSISWGPLPDGPPFFFLAGTSSLSTGCDSWYPSHKVLSFLHPMSTSCLYYLPMVVTSDQYYSLPRLCPLLPPLPVFWQKASTPQHCQLQPYRAA